MRLGNKEFVLSVMKRYGLADATNLQSRSAEMSGTEINNEDFAIPSFTEAIRVKNMLERHAGMRDGFICKSSAGRVVRLIQNYDSNIFTEEPEELSALYGFVWSTDPRKALPFIALSTSPYNIGDCCTENGAVYRSKLDSNVFAPSEYPQGWEIVFLN